jgi:hypothetical protein
MLYVCIDRDEWKVSIKLNKGPRSRKISVHVTWLTKLSGGLRRTCLTSELNVLNNRTHSLQCQWSDLVPAGPLLPSVHPDRDSCAAETAAVATLLTPLAVPSCRSGFGKLLRIRAFVHP